MFLLFLLSVSCCLLLGDGHWWHHQTQPVHDHHSFQYQYVDWRDLYFDNVASQVIAADYQLSGLCSLNNIFQEFYGESGYRVVYNIPDFKEDTIVVTIKHRVLYVTANKIGSATETFVNIRILPDILEESKGSWMYEDGKLQILFPYRPAVCRVIDTNAKFVRKSVPGNIDVRFGQQNPVKEDEKMTSEIQRQPDHIIYSVMPVKLLQTKEECGGGQN